VVGKPARHIERDLDACGSPARDHEPEPTAGLVERCTNPIFEGLDVVQRLRANRARKRSRILRANVDGRDIVRQGVPIGRRDDAAFWVELLRAAFDEAHPGAVAQAPQVDAHLVAIVDAP